ncbi:MAG: UbiA family prenyltransferase [Sphingobacteriales bacterium]|jgi:1,4-dihydroxy-2-naphthoate octaprenyltransferase|nr:UbiA family prenyltransferase [Sphingobacteriales bacterium]OJW31117.1 MAG: hypothetical protein BGO54_07490 [Sphingobacteriales bacterium 46-32]
MRLLRHLFHFFIYSNLFIAGCAVLMAWQTCLLLLDGTIPAHLLPFIFSATICSYSFHWYLSADAGEDSPRLRWLRQYRWLHMVLFIMGLAGSIYYGIYLIDHWLWLLVTAFITFLYSAPKIPLPVFRWLRRVALGKTIFLALVWTHVTSILPPLMAGVHWQPAFTLFALSRFFLIYPICILFDYRDREYDRSIGIRSLITWMSDKAIRQLFIVCISLFFIWTGLLAVCGWPLSTLLLLAIPGIITFFLYSYASKNFSDTLYYFALDGLMALSALLSWCLHF